MKNKKHFKTFLEGFNSAFDLSGIGFAKSYSSNHNINKSWYNVGTFFDKSFNESKSTIEENNTRKRSLQY